MVKWGSGSSTYEQDAYDASGNRTVQRAVSGGTTTITVYAFGLEEYQYSSTGTLTDSAHYYTLGGKLVGALTGLSTPTTVMFLTDALGSLLATFTNTAGTAAIQGNQVYGPYGNQLYSSHTSMDTAKGYTGQYSDALTGLDYYVSRYYDPVADVFLSADVKQGNAQGMNSYAYVGGNPETRNDPTGQYYSNGTPLSDPGGAIGYVYGDYITTITNDNLGITWTASGQETWNSCSCGLSIDTSTREQITKYGGYNPDTDTSNSPWAKFLSVTGWTDLQQSWNEPGATWQSRLKALLRFFGTNANNAFQLAMIFGGGPEGEGADLAGDAGSEIASNLLKYQEQVTSHIDAQAAFDYAMEKIGGPLGEDAVPTFARGLHGDDAVAGLQNGYREGINSWRLDYDPEKGPHFNWMVGKRADNMYGAATFPGTYDTYINMDTMPIVV